MQHSTRGRLPFYATITGSLAIAGALLAVSFGHIQAFATLAGAEPWEAVVIAATVDALVILAIAAIGQAKRAGVRPPAMAKVALVVGIVATTGANLHYGWSHGWMGIVVSLWVPVAAELAYQLAMAAVRIGAGGGQERRPVICGHVVPVSAVVARVGEEEPAAGGRPAAPAVICGGRVPVPQVMKRVSGGRRVPAPRPRPTGGGSRRPAPAAVASVTDLAARERAVVEWLAGPDAPANVTGEVVAARLGVSDRTGRRILDRVRPVVARMAEGGVCGRELAATGG